MQKENENKIKNGWYIKVSQAAFYAMSYIIASNVKKVFSFKVDEKALEEIVKITDRLYIEQISF